MTRRITTLLIIGVTVLVTAAASLLRADPRSPESDASDRTTVMSTTERDVRGDNTSTAGSVTTDESPSVLVSEAGAVEAAMELAVAPQTWLYLSDEELEAAIRRVAVPSSADVLIEDITAEVGLARDALARSPGRIWWVVSPLAWRVDSFVGDRAQISVWTVSVLSATDVAMPQADWATTSLDLEWTGTRWRLVATRDTAGPTPQLGGRDDAWQPEPFDDALAGFTRVGAEPS